jgi:hypothetical protein
LRILDEDSDKRIDNVCIFLTKDEAVELRDDLNQLLDNPKLHHTHLSNADYQKEITICLYNEKDLQGFHPRAIKLIKEDE